MSKKTEPGKKEQSSQSKEIKSNMNEELPRVRVKRPHTRAHNRGFHSVHALSFIPLWSVSRSTPEETGRRRMVSITCSF